MSSSHSLEHGALIYDSADSFLEFGAGYLREGVEGGESVYAPVRDAQERALRDSLGDAAEAVTFLRAPSFYASPIRTIHNHAALLFTRSDADPPVRAIGEIPWPDHSDVAVREWSRMEAVFDYVFGGCAARIVCVYDERALPDEAITVARSNHPVLHGPDGTRGNPEHVEAGTQLERLLRSALPEPVASVAEIDFADDPGRARRFATGRAAEAGLAGDLVENLAIAVGEVAANAIVHGAEPRRLRLWTEDQNLVCDVTDGGAGFDDVLAGVLHPEGARDDGWGLWLAHELCDQVEIRSWGERTVVRLHLRQSRPWHLHAVST